MARISHVDFYQPESVVSTKELLSSFVPSDAVEKFIAESGILTVCVERDRTALQMADHLLERLRVAMDLEDVTHLFFASPVTVEDGVFIPYALVEKYKMSRCSIVTLQQHCASCVQAMQLATALIDTGASRKALVLSLSAGMPIEKRLFGATVFGDGAGILVLEPKGFFEIKRSCCWSDGSLSYGKFNGRQRNAFQKVAALERAVRFLKRSLIGDDLQGSILIPLNTGNVGMTVSSVMLEVPLDNIYAKNISGGGHMLDADIIRNLSTLLRENRLKSGDEVALYAVGLEMATEDTTYALALLTYHGELADL